jgi:Holliday junction resolvase RusA-like endonuclease
MEQKKPKTFKLYIPGEVIRQLNSFTFADGRTVTIPVMEKIVVPSKKNQQRIAVNKATLKPILLDSEQHAKWKKENLEIFKRYAELMAMEGFRMPLTRAKIKVLFYFPDSKDRDLSNKFETIADIMVDTGILMDDKFKVLKPIYLDGWVKRDRPRTEIYLTLITADMSEFEWDLTSKAHEEKIKAKKKLQRQIRDEKKRQERQLLIEELPT